MTSSPKRDDMPRGLSSAWRLCKLGYRHEPRLLLAAFLISLLSALPDALIAVWLALLGSGILQHDRGRVFFAAIAIGISAFPTVAISIWQGIKGLDTQLSGMGTAFHLSKSAIFQKIIVPQLVPQILASMRSALGICWKICTTVELVGMSSGVGYMLNYWFGLFKMPQVFAWTLSFLIVMFGIEFLLFKPIENRLTRWRA